MCEADYAAVSHGFLYLGSSIPRLRGFQIYTQYERCATSSARAVAGAIRARSSQYHDVSCIVQRNLNVLADFAAVSHGFCTCRVQYP